VSLKSFRRIGLQDTFPDVVGDQPYLRTRYGLDAPSVAMQVRQAVLN
jgi:transketolase C-terminal domain/subunit